MSYLTTDQHILGFLAWLSFVITCCGFGIAIWQLAKLKRSAEAARVAVLGLERRVRSRELFAQLSSAHYQLETARSHFARGEPAIAMACLELSAGSVIEARELSRFVEGSWRDLQFTLVRLRRAAERMAQMTMPPRDHPDFGPLTADLRKSSEVLRSKLAQARYSYDLDGGK